MRKSVLAVLLVMSIILIFCAGCGSSNDEPVAAVSATMAPTPEPTAEPEATPEPTAEPEATPEPTEEPAEESAEEPEEEEPEETTSGNNSNSGNTQSQATAKPEPTAEPEPEVDKFSVAQNMTGRSVQDLFAAIGQPNGSEYTTSCLVFDGEDGLLYYGDFTVSTVRYSDGTELVMGAY